MTHSAGKLSLFVSGCGVNTSLVVRKKIQEREIHPSHWFSKTFRSPDSLYLRCCTSPSSTAPAGFPSRPRASRARTSMAEACLKCRRVFKPVLSQTVVTDDQQHSWQAGAFASANQLLSFLAKRNSSPNLVTSSLHHFPPLPQTGPKHRPVSPLPSTGAHWPD